MGFGEWLLQADQETNMDRKYSRRAMEPFPIQVGIKLWGSSSTLASRVHGRTREQTNRRLTRRPLLQASPAPDVPADHIPPAGGPHLSAPCPTCLGSVASCGAPTAARGRLLGGREDVATCVLAFSRVPPTHDDGSRRGSVPGPAGNREAARSAANKWEKPGRPAPIGRGALHRRMRGTSPLPLRGRAVSVLAQARS